MNSYLELHKFAVKKKRVCEILFLTFEMIPWFHDNPQRDINLHVYEFYSKVKTSYRLTRTFYKNDLQER